MRILHILDHSIPVLDGYSLRSHNICLVQKQIGWNPVVITSPKHEESWTGAWYAFEEFDGIHYFRCRRICDSRWPLQGEVKLMAALKRRMREVVEDGRPDLFHVHSPILNAIPALTLGNQMGIPVLYEMRALWEDAAVNHGTYSERSWKYRLVRSLETWVCRRAAHVTVLCKGLKEELLQRGIPPHKLTVIANGVSVEDFGKPEPDEDYRREWLENGKKVVGFIGSFYRYEGLDLLLEAMALLRKKRSDVLLLLVGSGLMEDELKKRVVQLGLEAVVRMPGQVAPNRVPNIYPLIDILVYPRQSIRLTELVTPLKPLEAMAMGKPLVASDIGGHRELIQDGETGILFPAGDASALAERLHYLLENGESRRNMAERAYHWVRAKRTWATTTSPYKTVYSNILKKSFVLAGTP